ncbi:MAG: porin family protein [Gemmatimonadota bacterium]|nr:porin family protein [Gemmatimonadota bacterium]MDH5758315.1 porin family protein [Gemmatimonadota bacterium]
MNRLMVAVLLASLGAVIPASAGAQARSGTEGFHLGASVGGASITFENSDGADNGGSMGFVMGYGFSPLVTAYLNMNGASMDISGSNVSGTASYTLAHADLGVRFSFGSSEKSVRPYLATAFSGRAANINLLGEIFEVRGPAFTVGGGVAIFVTPSGAVDIGLKLTGGKFDEATFLGEIVAIDQSAVSARFDVGFMWWAG